MRATGGTRRLMIIMAFLMVLSACAAEQAESAKDVAARTGSTVDLFATTVPELAAVVPTTEAAPKTTEAPSTSTTAVDEANRRRSGQPVPTTPEILPGHDPDDLLWIGYWLGHSEGRDNIKFVLAPDGSVLRIQDGDIYSGALDYTTWNIGPAGYSAILELISDLGLTTDRLDNSGQSGEIRSSGFFSVRIENVNDTAGLDAEQRQLRRDFHLLMARLDDPSWLDGITEVTPPAPWVPDQLAVNVRNEYNPIYYSTEPFAWPFDETIRSMAGDSTGDDLWVCLEGADAETAWTTFMIGGVNNARLPIEADGQLWEAGVRVSHPMYSGISPCPAATGFGTGSSDRVNSADLTELFLTVEDLGGDWEFDGPSIAPSPPNIQNCSPITDGELAVAEFDSWLSQRATFDSAGIVGGFQMLGEVPDGADAVSVIERVGTYSCLDGLGQFGVIGIESGMVDAPPDGVAAAAYWILDWGYASQVVIDAVLDNGLAMVIALQAPLPMTVDELEPIFALAVDKATSR